MRLVVRDSFPAAHRIRIDTRGTLEPVHVHHWRVEACFDCSPECDEAALRAQRMITGWVQRHRGRSFNDVPPFETVNPTAEEVARILCQELQRTVPELPVRYVRIGEAAGFSATYRP